MSHHITRASEHDVSKQVDVTDQPESVTNDTRLVDHNEQQGDVGLSLKVFETVRNLPVTRSKQHHSDVIHTLDDVTQLDSDVIQTLDDVSRISYRLSSSRGVRVLPRGRVSTDDITGAANSTFKYPLHSTILTDKQWITDSDNSSFFGSSTMESSNQTLTSEVRSSVNEHRSPDQINERRAGDHVNERRVPDHVNERVVPYQLTSTMCLQTTLPHSSDPCFYPPRFHRLASHANLSKIDMATTLDFNHNEAEYSHIELSTIQEDDVMSIEKCNFLLVVLQS